MHARTTSTDTLAGGRRPAQPRGWKGLAAWLLLVPTLVVLGAQTTTPAAGAEVCSGEHLKPIGDDKTSFTYTAPEGYLVSGWCVKSSTTPEYHDANDGHGHRQVRRHRPRGRC